MHSARCMAAESILLKCSQMVEIMNSKVDMVQAKPFIESGRDIPSLLYSWVERAPEKNFLVWEPFTGARKTWSYERFAEQVEAIAGSLHERGVNNGEKVLLHMDNSPEFVLSWFACARLGAVAVSTNTRCVARDMSYFAEHAEVVCAITQPQYSDLIFQTAPNLKFLSVTDNDAGEPGEIPGGINYVPFQELVESTAVCPKRSVDAMADLGIQFTSGTTSRPKAVLWTHANAVWGARMNTMHFRLNHADTTQTFLPLFHTNAQSYSMLSTLWVGGTIVVQPKFSATRFWEVAERNQCTWSSMIPFCLKALLGQPVPEKHNFRLWVTAVRLKMAEDFFRVSTLGLWGMTETITQGIVSDCDQLGPEMSIGRASPGYEIAIKHEDGSLIGPGERGRLFIRAPRGIGLFKEYYKNPEATDKSFDNDGWFNTGDLVRMDETGELFFSDRDKDMLKVGAENVAASEVEAVVMETGLVSECAVVGQKHYMLDEVPVVFVIPAPHAGDNVKEKIIAHCQANLPDFKVVRAVHIVEQLPRSTLEKIAKNELRDRLPAITADNT